MPKLHCSYVCVQGISSSLYRASADHLQVAEGVEGGSHHLTPRSGHQGAINNVNPGLCMGSIEERDG